MTIIFDIKKYEPGKNKYEDYGYCVFPLFSTLNNPIDMTPENFVNSGIYSVNIFVIIF